MGARSTALASTATRRSSTRAFVDLDEGVVGEAWMKTSLRVIYLLPDSAVEVFDSPPGPATASSEVPFPP
jgi:hypothetical protein